MDTKICFVKMNFMRLKPQNNATKAEYAGADDLFPGRYSYQ